MVFFVAKLQKFSDTIPNSNQKSTDVDIELEEEEEEETSQNLPKKIDKRDWYYKDVIEKRKKQREDTHHILKVFEKPSKINKKLTLKNTISLAKDSKTETEQSEVVAANALRTKKKRDIFPLKTKSSLVLDKLNKQKKINNRLSIIKKSKVK